MEIIKITKSIVDKLPYPAKGQVFYRDKSLQGFGLYVGAKSKTYYAEKRVNGKTVRHKLGKHGDITAEMARNLAKVTIGDMAQGINPNEGKKALKAKSVTLKKAYSDYRAEKKNLKPKTLYDYDRVMEVVFKSWLGKHLTQISKDMVAKKYTKLGNENGKAYANLSMRLLRAIYNFSKWQYDDGKGSPFINENPVDRISQAGGWYKIKRRETVIQPEELSDWYHAVLQIPNETFRDYLIFALFTGMRREEVGKLKWDQINTKAKTMTLHDTKNNQTLTLPLSDFLWKLLSDRKKTAINEFVFPGPGANGHMVDPRSAIKLVTEKSGIKFMVHDLRRTYISIASGLVTAYELKMLVNHKMDTDVTGGYIIPNLGQLRKCTDTITRHLLGLIGENKPGKIIQLQK
jgi:integrase